MIGNGARYLATILLAAIFAGSVITLAGIMAEGIPGDAEGKEEVQAAKTACTPLSYVYDVVPAKPLSEDSIPFPVRELSESEATAAPETVSAAEEISAMEKTASSEADPVLEEALSSEVDPAINQLPAVEEGRKGYFDVPLSEELQDYIFLLCGEYGVPATLVIGMIETESNFSPTIVSETNDFGLMQINVCNHAFLREKLGVGNFLDPFENVHSGIFLLSQCLSETDGDVSAALMVYNCGRTGAKRRWSKGIYETAYTKKLLAAAEKYEKGETDHA